MHVHTETQSKMYKLVEQDAVAPDISQHRHVMAFFF